MYVPTRFKMQDQEKMLTFMRNNSFALLISTYNNRLYATHLPFVVEEKNERLALVSHMALGNEQVPTLQQAACLVVFSGPHGYVSPKHYDKLENVPTWDYVAVHAYGEIEILDQEEQKRETLEGMINYYEASYSEQWKHISEVTKKRMQQGIVAFKLWVNELQAQEKVSQNRTTEELKRISTAFAQSPLSQERELTKYIEPYIKKK